MGSALFQLILVYFIFMNIMTFVLYGVDKYKAVHHRFRISEASLLLFGFLGGAYGAAVGMQLWHHKTRKWKFRLVVPLSVVLLTLVLWLLLYFHGVLV